MKLLIKLLIAGGALSASAFQLVLSNPVGATLGDGTGSATVTPRLNLWSDPATWGGSVPIAGDNIVIPLGKTVIWDVVTPALGSLTIAGSLIADTTKDLGLTAKNVVVSGTWRIGDSEASPYTKNASITINGAMPGTVDPTATARSIQITGNCDFYGIMPVTFAKLSATAESAATSLTLDTATGWKSGDRIAIAPTTWYGASNTDERILSADASGASVSLTVGVSARRWGQMQYVTDAGLSLTPGTLTKSAATPTIDWDATPKTIDERAEVINLTRNIVIQAPNDSDFTTNGFGVHTMVMQGGRYRWQGVEVVRGGQQGFVGRYPIHWHMMSYNMPNGMSLPSDGTFIGDISGQFIRGCSIRDSSQRAIVVHGTCGAVVDDNVAYNITSNAIFLEEGAERRNYIRRNVVLKVRSPPDTTHPVTGASRRIRAFDASTADFGPTGFWITNPDNTIVDNVCADAEGFGIWNSFAQKKSGMPGGCVGLSAQIAITPSAIALTNHTGNTGHSCRLHGMTTEFTMVDTAGNLELSKYQPQSDEVGGRSDGAPQAVGATLTGVKLWGNNNNGYRNRVGVSFTYTGWAVSNNQPQHLFGAAGDKSVATRMLRVGTTLNTDLQTAPPGKPSNIRTGIASYHHSLNMTNSLVVNHPFTEPELGALGYPVETGGAVLVAGCDETLWDLYLSTLEFGFVRNTGNKYINSIPAYRTPSRYLQQEMTAYYGGTSKGDVAYEISSAIPDPNGYVGPANNWWVYDRAFFTSGASVTQVAPSGRNGVSVDGTYYGLRLGETTSNNEGFNNRAMNVVRYNSSDAVVDTFVCPRITVSLDGSITSPGGGKGTIGSLVYNSTGAAVRGETWTITATSSTNFTVVGSVSGAKANATVGTPYVNGYIDFTITAGGTPFVSGDIFSFATYSFSTFAGLARGTAIRYSTTDRYSVELPDDPTPNTVRMVLEIKGARTASDIFIGDVPWSNSVPARVGTCTSAYSFYANGYHPSGIDIALGAGFSYTAASSLADLKSGAANRFWQDTTNNKVYFKFRGVLTHSDSTEPTDSDRYLMWTTYLGVSPL